MKWSTAEEIARFDELWKLRVQHCRVGDWNQRADDWNKELRDDAVSRERTAYRVHTTAEFLRQHGLLLPGHEVIDIGCGHGRFSGEFARTAGHITATDLSPRMIEHSSRYARELGLNNLTFLTCDFQNADLDAMGWRNRFDLVFSSLSPAVACKEDLIRLEYVSRGYCAYQTFAFTKEPIAREILGEVCPGAVCHSHKDGRSYYAAFNLLWLMGRFPLTKQYCERRTESLAAGRPLAMKIARKLPEDAASDDVLERIYRRVMEAADENGMIAYPSEYWYGLLLWNVNERMDLGYDEMK